MSQTTYRVAAVQYRLRGIQRFEDFAAQAGAYVATAKGEFDAHCVVLPEWIGGQLMSIPVNGGGGTIRDLAAYAPRYLDLFKRLARDHAIAIVAGSTVVAEGNKLYNVASFVHADGRVDAQPKLHLTPTEAGAWGLAPGDALTMIELPFGKAAILICYDTEFPELARQARARGAKVIFTPSCTDDRHGFWRVRYTAQARAIEDQVYVVVAHTTGGLPTVENLRSNVGQAAILCPCDYPFPHGGVLAQGEMNDDMVIAADLDIAAIDRAQQGGSVRTWQDRRGGTLYPDIA